MTENTRVKVCSESSTADRDSVRVEPYKVLEQNDQLQNELQEQIVKHQKLKKRNAQLHVKLLEEKELLKFLGKNDRMQKKIDKIENHHSQLIAKVMIKRDRLLAEKEQRSEENRKLKQQVGELKRVAQKVRDEKKAALKAKTLEFRRQLDWPLEQEDADRIRLESEKKSLQREVQQCRQENEERKTKESLDATFLLTRSRTRARNRSWT